MRPSDAPIRDNFPPARFLPGKIQVAAIVGALVALAAIALYFGWLKPGIAAGLAFSLMTDWRGWAGLVAIGLVGWIVWLLDTIRRHQQLENTLRQFHQQLEASAQDRAAQLSATNALLLAEVQRVGVTNLALEISESRLKMALDTTQTMIWDLNLQTGEVVRSGNIAALFGITQSTLAKTQAAFLERVHPDDRDSTQQTMLDAITHQTPLHQEYRVIWDDGSIHWLSARGQVRRDRQDGDDHMIGTTIDITQQKWLEEELRLSQELNQAIIEASSLSAGLEVVLRRMCAAIDWDFAEAWLPAPEGEFLRLNCTCCGCDPRVQDFVSLSRSLSLPMNVALPGRVWAAQQPEWLLDLPQASSEQFIRVEAARAAGLQTAVGVPILVEGQTIAIFLFYSFTPRAQDDRVIHLLSALTDRLSATIQRKRAEEKLQESHTLMQTVFDSTPDPIFVKDLQGRYRMVNAAASEVMGRSAVEILGQDDTQFFSPEVAQALWQSDQQIMTTGSTLGVEEKVFLNGAIHYFLSTKSVWRNVQSEAIGLIGVARDITDRVQAREATHQQNQELERRVRERTAQLETANKELETFSYSVSHDLRSPLRSIDGFSQILLTRYHDSLDTGGQHYLQRIRANAHRMGELIDDLLQLSRVTLGAMQSQPVNLGTIAQEIASQLSATQPDRGVEWTIAPQALTQGDPRLLRVVLENLLGNAWKYTAQKPIAQIEFGVCSLSDLDAATPQPSHDRLFCPRQWRGVQYELLEQAVCRLPAPPQ